MSEIRSQLKTILPGMILDIGIPIGIYYLLKWLEFDDIIALISGGIVSGLIALSGVIKKHTVDVSALFVMVLFFIGLIILFITNDPRFIFLKHSISSGAAGIFFIVSALLNKPIIAAFARRGMTKEHLTNFDHAMQNNTAMQRSFRNASILSGIILMIEAIIRVPMIYYLPVSVMVTLAPIMSYGTIVTVVVISVKYIKWSYKKMH